jgi:predicted chitinase
MDLTFPINLGDDTATETGLYQNNEAGDHGFFPVGRNHFWHGGVHFTFADNPVLAVADGEVIAYRINNALKEYKGVNPKEDEPPPTGEAPKYFFSNGFVLIRHKFVTPMGTEIPFYSLYMHLKPMTEDETKEESDTTQPPFIFKVTHWMVATDADGGGMPIVDAGVEQSLGVIPYGSHFTVHPNDDMCNKHRYRKIKYYRNKLKGYVLIDAGKATSILTGLSRTRARILEVDDAKIFNETRKDTGRVIPKKGFFTIHDAPDGHFSKKMRYQQMVHFKAGALRQGFVTTADLAHSKVIAGKYRKADAEIPLLDLDGTNTGGSVRAERYFMVTEDKFPATHWTQTPANKPLKYQQVESYENALIGFGMVDATTKAAVKKTAAAEQIDLVEESAASAGFIGPNQEYLVTAQRPTAGTTIATIKYEKIEYPDPKDAGPLEGYAFLREGYDITHLDKTSADSGKLYLWGENAMTVLWDNEILAEGDRNSVGQLDGWDEKAGSALYSIFEMVDDALIPAGHWSRTTGWRPATYKAEAKQGQAEQVISGYCFVDAHVAVADGAAVTPAADQVYKLLQKGEVDALGKKLVQPPKNASIHYRVGMHSSRNLLDFEKHVHGLTRPWDGKYNGTNIRKSASATAQVLTVLQQGTVVKFKDEVKFKSQAAGSGYVLAPTKVGYYELSDGGFAYANTSDTVKRAELPKPIQFNTVVPLLTTPIPIKRGDIVGYGGTYLDATGLTHMEIFTGDRAFTTNPNRDRWGTMAVRFDPTAIGHTKEAIPIEADKILKLPVNSSLRVLSRDRSEKAKGKGPVYCSVRVLGADGWLKKSDLQPLADPPPDPIPTERKLAGALDKLFDHTKEVKKKDAEGHDIVVTEVNDATGSHPIPGKAGQTVTVLAQVDDVYHVKYENENEGKIGWISEDELNAKTSDKLDSAIMTNWYIATSELSLSPVDPARNFKFSVPTPKAKADALQNKLKALPTVEREGKAWIEKPLSESEDVFDKDGNKWVGITLGPGEQVWLADSAVTRLSREYDWLDWKYVQEKNQENKPDPNNIDESLFTDDGFCDIDFLLTQLDVVDRDAHNNPLPQYVKERDIKTKLATVEELRKKLRSLACVHPTEWDYETDTAINKWDRLHYAPFNMRDDNAAGFHNAADYDKTIDHIKEMQWWDTVTTLPTAKAIWNFHPIGFIANLKRMPFITRAKLIDAYGESAAGDIDDFIEHINDTMQRYDINTPLRQAHFLAQVAAESSFFHLTEEGNPGNYEGRKDLGNILPGDGKLFIGRGLIQITGRDRYTAYERFTGEDVTSSEDNAKKVKEPKLAADSAGWFWTMAPKNLAPHDLNVVADGGTSATTVRALTTRINGGVNHLGRRVMLFNRIIRALHG